jgi:uncharacterized membrane protein YeaQ/YmgE (transglycosylase-associated protein family)
MSGIGKFGITFVVGVLAGYLACLMLPRGRLGVVLACVLSSISIATFLFFFYPAKLQTHFVSIDVSSLFSWVAICSVPGLLGYWIRRWYEPWIDAFRKDDEKNLRR